MRLLYPSLHACIHLSSACLQVVSLVVQVVVDPWSAVAGHHGLPSAGLSVGLLCSSVVLASFPVAFCKPLCTVESGTPLDQPAQP